MKATAARFLDSALVAYSYLPHHPGKGWIYDRAFDRLEFTRGTTQLRLKSRFGVRFECDLTDKVGREIYYLGYDRRDCRVLSRLIKSKDVVLDIGANIGYFTLLFARWAREGAVHAFEPFPETMRKCRRNLDLNPRLKDHVVLHPLGVSDCVGAFSMVAPDPGNSGVNYLSTGASPDAPNVMVTTLDEFTRGLARVDFIKIDVEGSEVGLLHGAAETLMRFRPVLMIEINASTLGRFGKTPANVVELLGQYGYRLCYATRTGMLRPLSRLPKYGEEPNVFAFPID